MRAAVVYFAFLVGFALFTAACSSFGNPASGDLRCAGDEVQANWSKLETKIRNPDSAAAVVRAILCPEKIERSRFDVRE